MTNPTDDVVRELRRKVAIPPPRGRHAAASEPVGPPRGRGLRRVIVALVVVALLAVALGVRVFGHGEPVAAEASVAADRAVSWEQVLGRLDDTRSVAWSSGAVDALRDVDVAGSRADVADRAALTTLRTAGLSPRGLRFELALVGVVAKSPNRVVLRVVDRRRSYTLVDRGGLVRSRVPARGDRAWMVVLRASNDGRWRYVEAKALSP